MSKYECQKCGKLYKTRSGLWKHSKKCEGNKETNSLVNKKVQKLKSLQLEIKKLELQDSLMSENKEVLIDMFLSKTKGINIKEFCCIIHECTLKYCKNLNDFTEIIKQPFMHLVRIILDQALKQCNNKFPFYCLNIRKEEYCVYDNNYWNYKNIDEKLKYIIYRVRNSLVKQLREYDEENVISNTNFTLWENIANYIMNTSIGDGLDIDKNNNYIIESVIKPMIIENCLVANKI